MPNPAQVRRDPQKGKKGFSNKGFTLIEMMIVVGVIAIILSLALPSYRSIIEKRQVTSGAEQLAGFVSAVQMEAVRRNEPIAVRYMRTDQENWCIGLSLGPTACDCEQTSVLASDFCQIDGAMMKLVQTDFVDLGFEFFHAADTDSSFSFDPVRGTIANNESSLFSNPYMFYLHNDMKVDEQRFYELQLKINRTGRIHICADDDRRSTIGGYPAC